MTSETITRVKLIADNGMMLTDGEVYGKEIFLATGVKTDAFYEITEAEYEEVLKKQEEMK